MWNYLIIEKNRNTVDGIQSVLNDFEDFTCIGVTDNYKNSMTTILKEAPNLIFFNIDNAIDEPFHFINELNSYSDDFPSFIAISSSKDKAYKAIKSGFDDLLLCPLSALEIRKSVMVFQKKNRRKNKKSICLKSYKDYQYLQTDEILFLKADNNTTDFHMNDGTIISAFKTLKSYEEILPKNFFRVHKSYILNKNHVSRIQYGKLICSIRKSKQDVPFTRTYLDNIEYMNNRLSQNTYQSCLN